MSCPLLSVASAASTMASLACPASFAGFKLATTHTRLPASCCGWMNCARPACRSNKGPAGVDCEISMCLGQCRRPVGHHTHQAARQLLRLIGTASDPHSSITGNTQMVWSSRAGRHVIKEKTD
jgi:hypothetical protein